MPLPSQAALAAFLTDFFYMGESNRSNFLNLIKESSSIEELASCDAAWWARLILTGQLDNDHQVRTRGKANLYLFYSGVHSLVRFLLPLLLLAAADAICSAN